MKFVVYDFGSVIRVKGPLRAAAVEKLCNMFNAKLDELDFPNAERYDKSDFKHLPNDTYRVEPSTMKQFIRGKNWLKISLGEYTRAEVFEQSFESYGITDPEFKKEIIELYDFTGKHVMEEFKQLLAELKQVPGLQLAICSNHGDTLPDWLENMYHIVPNLIPSENVVVSFQHGVKKPDPQIYEILLSKIGATKEDQILFIDNKAANCEAAEKFGMIGFNYLHDASDEKASLEVMRQRIYEFIGPRDKKPAPFFSWAWLKNIFNV